MEQKHIWDYFQSKRQDIFEGSFARLKYISNRLNKSNRILNIGVGGGVLEAILSDEGKEIYSLDPSELIIDRLIHEFKMSDRAKVGFSQDIPFPDNYFDAVVMSEVLEHLDDQTLFLTIREVHRVLTFQGVFLGTVPADEDLKISEVVCPSCANVFHRWGHVQKFTKRRLEEILKSQFDNFFICRKYFGCWQALNFKGRVSWILKSLLNVLGIEGESETLFFMAKRKK